MSLNTENIATIAENVYFSVIDELNMNDECINLLVDGSTENTMRGQELYYMIESAIENAFTREDD
jgi:hypothetical protein